MNPGIDDRPLTTDDVAVFLGVSPRTVERWRLLRIGPPFFKLSARSVRYSSAALREWRDRQRVTCE
jgi:predicted DNA-binding transcriptional regulator AlpA